MKDIIIVGAGSFGREMESWLELLPSFNKEFKIKGYLDNNLNALKGYPSDYRVLGKPLEYEFAENDCVLICVANTKAKKQLVSALRNKVQFFTYVAPSATIAKFTEINKGSIICPNALIATNAKIGEFVIINGGSQIGHDSEIGSFSSIMANVDLGGHVILGENVFIGSNATIIPGKKIASDIIIGAGSIIFQNLKKTGTYFGNPAKLITY